MDLGNGLLLACIACSLGAAASSIPFLVRRVPWDRTLSTVLAACAFASVSGAFLLLVSASVSTDFTYAYVWKHTSSDLSPLYRLSAVWAGGEGALLLCAWLIAVVLMAETTIGRSGIRTGQGFRRVFAATMSLLLAFFSLTALMSGLFDHTAPASLVASPDGLGMDVLLQTPEMAVHAPLIFVAYASLAAVFSASVASTLTGEDLWYRTALRWGRLAWLTLTTGIGLGAVWAYYVIGWGGYWSWDPVETSSLIPWLMATAFLHTQLTQTRRREYAVSSPTFGMLSFVGVVFVSFVVRAGGLWSSSVHDYGAAGSESALSRLSTLLNEEPSVAGTLAFLLLLVAITATLSVVAMRRAGPQSSPPAPRRLSDYITDQNVLFLALTVFSLSALVAATLMVKNIGSDQAATYAELDQKMSLVFVAVMVALGLCLVWRSLGRVRALQVSVALLGASVCLAALAAVTGVVPAMVALALPSFLFALCSSMFRLVKSVTKGHVRTRLFRAGAQVVHLGIALTLVAYVASSNMQSYPLEGDEVAMPVGAFIAVGGYTITLVGLEVSDDVSGCPSGVDQIRIAAVEIREDGRLVEERAELKVLYSYDAMAGYSELERVAFVESTLSEDLYLSFEWMSEETALLHAKVVPMMLPLWTGMVLLLAGSAMRMIAFTPPPQPARTL